METNREHISTLAAVKHADARTLADPPELSCYALFFEIGIE